MFLTLIKWCCRLSPRQTLKYSPPTSLLTEGTTSYKHPSMGTRRPGNGKSPWRQSWIVIESLWCLSLGMFQLLKSNKWIEVTWMKQDFFILRITSINEFVNVEFWTLKVPQHQYDHCHYHHASQTNWTNPDSNNNKNDKSLFADLLQDLARTQFGVFLLQLNHRLLRNLIKELQDHPRAILHWQNSRKLATLLDQSHTNLFPDSCITFGYVTLVSQLFYEQTTLLCPTQFEVSNHNISESVNVQPTYQQSLEPPTNIIV